MSGRDSFKELLNTCRITTDQILTKHRTNQPHEPSIGPSLDNLVARQAAVLNALHEQALNPATDGIDLEADVLLHKRLGDLLVLADEKFELIKYDLIPSFWRQLYTDVRILMFHHGLLRTGLLSWLLRGRRRDDRRLSLAAVSEEVDRLVFCLDMALIKAGDAPQRGRNWCNRALELLQTSWDAFERATDHKVAAAEDGPSPSKRARTLETSWEIFPSFSAEILFQPPVTRPVERVSNVSLGAWESFLDPATNTDGVQPLIFTDLMTHWPALTDRPWNKPAYLLSRTFGGRRYVPVEIGRSYLDAGWTQKLLPFKAFLTQYIDPSLATSSITEQQQQHQKTSPDGTEEQKKSKPPPTGYLAQHDLLSQIPLLRNDILLPDQLWTDPPRHPDPPMNKPKVDGPEINAWFGPRGTITPLHTDAMHNLLCQVVGRKYVRLYPPSASDALLRMERTAEGIDMSNSARVDVGVEEGWDQRPEGWELGELGEEERRRFREAEYVDCVLGPGETLYVPIGWWHYVRSLSASFSVSFWWN